MTTSTNADETVQRLLNFYEKHHITTEKKLIKELKKKDPAQDLKDMNIDLSKYQKITENDLYIVYLEKKPINSKLQQIYVYYKKYNRSMLATLTLELFNLFIKPAIQVQKQR